MRPKRSVVTSDKIHFDAKKKKQRKKKRRTFSVRGSFEITRQLTGKIISDVRWEFEVTISVADCIRRYAFSSVDTTSGRCARVPRI